MMKRIFNYTLLFLSLLPVQSLQLYSQEPAKIKPYVTLQYFKNTEGQRILQTTLTYSRNRMELPLPGMEVAFYTGADQKIILVKSTTNEKGVAKFELNDALKPATNSDGMWAFSSEFSGNDTIEGGTSEVAIKDMILEMELSRADSIKTVTIKAFAKEGGKEKPVSGETVIVYVPRMFSLLSIGELTLDDAGRASIEFPSDLPGDKEGNLVVIAKIEGNATFGNIEKRETIKWGLPTDYSVPVTHRALWTKIAPRWMIYSLSILLAGVWGHYMFAVISLIRIKIDADKKKAKEEYRM
jgi:hypothetical protein